MNNFCCAGISRDNFHKRRATGGKRKPLRKKRKFELGRPAANTKVSRAIPVESEFALGMISVCVSSDSPVKRALTLFCD